MEFKGKTILITRPHDQAAETIAEFERQRTTVIHIPLIEIVDPSDHSRELDHAIAHLRDYDWIVFTSQNAVTRFFARPNAPATEVIRQRIAVVGAMTAVTVRDLGMEDVIVAAPASAAGLNLALTPFDFAGKRVLVPRAEAGRDEVALALRKRGATVDVVAAYRTVIPRDLDREKLISLIAENKVHAVHFASPSAVRNFMSVIETKGLQAEIRRLDFLVIGPTTADAVRSYGFTPTLQPPASP